MQASLQSLFGLSCKKCDSDVTSLKNWLWWRLNVGQIPNLISIITTLTLISALLSCDYLIAEHCVEGSRRVEHTTSNKTSNMRDTHVYFILVTRSAGVQTEGETRLKDNLIHVQDPR